MSKLTPSHVAVPVYDLEEERKIYRVSADGFLSTFDCNFHFDNFIGLTVGLSEQ